MARVRAHNIGISLDGFATGEGLSLEAPFGHAGHRLLEWYFPTATFQAATGVRERMEVDPRAEPDDVFARRAWEGIGAEIMGAGKFGPPGWQDDADWTGWWGEEPPFHTPTFVLTHQPRESIEKKGGTVFHFRNAPIEEVLAEAREAADGQDVRRWPVLDPGLPRGRSRRPPARGRQPDHPGAWRTAVGRVGSPRGRLRRRVDHDPERRHARHLRPEAKLTPLGC